MAAEFPNVATDFPVVFTGNDDTVMPVMIMGFRDGENLYLDDDGHWITSYVPAFFRRYPFVFSSADEGKSFTLCIDTDFPGCNVEGRGERLFDAEGEQTQYLKNVLEFLKEYQLSYKRTEAFSQKLKDMDLLEPMAAQFAAADGMSGNLTGFMAVNREKIKTLTGDQLEKLAASDELELIYIHIQSLQNFTRMLEKLNAGTELADRISPEGQVSGEKTDDSSARPTRKKRAGSRTSKAKKKTSRKGTARKHNTAKK